MGSRPIVLPGRRLVEAGLLSVNASTMAYFLSAGAASPGIAAGCLLANATLSCIQGITTTCAVGSADTRTPSLPVSSESASVKGVDSRRYYRLERLFWSGLSC